MNRSARTDDSSSSGDDRSLVAAAQGGDRAALEVLLRRHYDRVHAVCRRILHNEQDAADATQDALFAAVRGLARFDGDAAFGTWLYRIATNTCLDQLRRRKRRPTTPLDAMVETSDLVLTGDHHGVPFDLTVVDHLELQAALARLPEEFRVAVVLRDVADLDYADIASTLDVPIGTVRSRIARGRALLARYLESAGAEGELAGNQTDPSDRRNGQS